MISCLVTAQLICGFVFAYSEKQVFSLHGSHDLRQAIMKRFYSGLGSFLKLSRVVRKSGLCICKQQRPRSAVHLSTFGVHYLDRYDLLSFYIQNLEHLAVLCLFAGGLVSELDEYLKVGFSRNKAKVFTRQTDNLGIFEPRCEKTGFLHMRKQRRRSAAQ